MVKKSFSSPTSVRAALADKRIFFPSQKKGIDIQWQPGRKEATFNRKRIFINKYKFMC